MNEANQKLKIENSSQQQALSKLTSLSKNDNETKKCINYSKRTK